MACEDWQEEETLPKIFTPHMNNIRDTYKLFVVLTAPFSTFLSVNYNAFNAFLLSAGF